MPENRVFGTIVDSDAGEPRGIAMTEAKTVITSASSIVTQVIKTLCRRAWFREPAPSSANSLGRDGALLSRSLVAERAIGPCYSASGVPNRCCGRGASSVGLGPRGVVWQPYSNLLALISLVAYIAPKRFEGELSCRLCW